MTAGYVDRSLMHNSALACFVLASFTREYQSLTANTRHPSLEKLLLVLPLVLHKPTRDGIRRRKSETPLHSVLIEEPRIIEGLRSRVAAHASVSCQGLNIACETGLLLRHENDGEVFFSFKNAQWPRGSSPTTISTDIVGGISRLARWFKDCSAAELFAMLGLT